MVLDQLNNHGVTKKEPWVRKCTLYEHELTKDLGLHCKMLNSNSLKENIGENC